VAQWMLRPAEKEKNLPNLIMSWTPARLSPLLATLGSHRGCGSPSLDVSSRTPARTRAVAEVALVYDLMAALEVELSKEKALKTFLTVEMRALASLARMELNGVGFCRMESDRQRAIMQRALEKLEKECYKEAGHAFALTSPEEICRVLYTELRLPLNGEPAMAGKMPPPAGKGRHSKWNPSSSKDVLIKLKSYHKLPGLILEWRKLSLAITKTVYPMQRACKRHHGLDMERIYTRCHTLSATGRISLHEPNVQGIPRDFDIRVNGDLGLVGQAGVRSDSVDIIGDSLKDSAVSLIGVSQYI